MTRDRCRFGLIAIFAFVLIAVMLSSSLAYASDAPSAQRRTVKVGFFQFDGYHMVDDDGNMSGYGYDLMQMLALHENWNLVFVGYDKSWSEMQQMLENGDIDILTSAQKTTERENQFAFSSSDIGSSSTMLTVKAGDTRYSSGDYQTYNGMRIGMLENSSRNDSLAEFAKTNGFSYTPVYFNSTSELVQALQYGRDVDAVLTSSLRSTHNEWILNEFDTSPFYVIVRKDDTSLLNEVNDAIAEVDASDPFWRKDLYSKYYTTDNGGELLLTEAERSYVQQLNSDGVVLKVLSSPDMKPYSYLEDGKFDGIIPEAFAEIARRVGVNYEFIDVSTQSEYESVLASGDADIVIDSALTYSQASGYDYKLSSPFSEVKLSRLMFRSNPGDATDIAITNALYQTLKADGALPDDESSYHVFDSDSECVDAVLDGDCDSAVMYYYCARLAANSDDLRRLSFDNLPESSVDIRLAISSDIDSRLASSFEKSAQSVSNESYVDQVSSDIGERETAGSRSVLGMIYDNIFLILAILALTVVVASVLIVGKNRKKRYALEEERQIALTQALEKAEEASAAKTDFLSRVSHDIRTPLNGIVGMTRIARKNTDSPEVVDSLDKIDVSSGLLLGLVNDILDLSKVESGKMEFNPEPYHIADFAKYLDAVIRPLCDEKGIDLRFCSDVIDNAVPVVDELRINQIFFNLLSNAVKFTPQGGTITCKISDSLTYDDRLHLHGIISDTGIGMSKDFLNHVFEPFSQEGRVDSSMGQGSGLGLAIAHNLFALMGGTMDVESELGEGTTFTLDLTTDYVTESVNSEATLVSENSPRLLAGRRVLVCEDNTINLEIASHLLKEEGMLVDSAENGKVGFDIFESSDLGYYDAILMDIRMPTMDGYAATHAIRTLDREDAATIPIIAMTANAYAEDIQSCKDAGMTAHVAKPIDPKILYSTISDALDLPSADDRDLS